MNIYFKVVEVQIQALEYIPKLGRDTSHPGGVLEEPHPKDQGIEGVSGTMEAPKAEGGKSSFSLSLA